MRASSKQKKKKGEKKTHTTIGGGGGGVGRVPGVNGVSVFNVTVYVSKVLQLKDGLSKIGRTAQRLPRRCHGHRYPSRNTKRANRVAALLAAQSYEYALALQVMLPTELAKDCSHSGGPITTLGYPPPLYAHFLLVP